MLGGKEDTSSRGLEVRGKAVGPAFGKPGEPSSGPENDNPFVARWPDQSAHHLGNWPHGQNPNQLAAAPASASVQTERNCRPGTHACSFPHFHFQLGANPTVAGVSESVAPPGQRGLCLYWLNKRLPLGGGQTKGLCPCDSPYTAGLRREQGGRGPLHHPDGPGETEGG